MAETRIGIISKNKHTRRKLHPRITNTVKAYAQQVGLVSWALNSVQTNLQAIFCHLIDNTDWRVGNRVWHSMKSDDGQRMALAALAEAKLPSNSQVRKNITWITEAAGKISGFRNDAIHTASTLQADNKGWHVVPSEDWGQPNRVERLQRIGHSKLFKAATGDLVQLSEYSHRVSIKLWDSSLTLPKRPRLLSILLEAKFLREKSIRQQQLLKSKPRRPPSLQKVAEAKRKRLALADALKNWKGSSGPRN